VSRWTKAVILGAGIGSRLRPITDSVPKVLVPVAGRPILDYWMEKLVRAGVRDALINTHAHPEQVRAYIADVHACGLMRMTESHEPMMLGSGGTLAANGHWAEDADQVVIIYPDNLSTVDLAAMLRYHEGHGDPFTMLLFRTPNPRGCGIAELGAQNRVVSFVEKPSEPKSDLANAGVYVVSADAYREMAAAGGKDIGFDLLPRFVGRMRGWAFGGYHRDIGSPADLAAVEEAARRLFGHPSPHNGTSAARPAVFLDRDGTLIHDVPYLTDPAKVRLLPGAAAAIQQLRDAGFAVVMVTNQSAIGRGMLTEEGLAAIHRELDAQLAREGTKLDGAYFCPVAPTTPDRLCIDHPDRKPAPGMILRAAEDLHLDLGRSWMVGDMVSDVLAGMNAGCRGSIFVRTGSGPASVKRRMVAGVRVVDDLPAAADTVLAESRR
jgi:histidinol-phosphate phosphatase family protein